jgi:hypothetical protein
LQRYRRQDQVIVLQAFDSDFMKLEKGLAKLDLGLGE